MSKQRDDHRVLMVYIEPTPYIQGLIAEIAGIWRPGIDVRYTASDVSQNWSRQLNADYESMLPAGSGNALAAIVRSLGRCRLLHLAGWGHPVLFGALIAGGLKRMPMTVETDTQLFPPASGLRRAAKRCLYPWLFRLPSAFVPAGSRQAAYLRHYGVSPNRMRIAQMTVDVARMVAFRDALSDGERLRVRRELGLADGAVTFLYVGRLEPHKGVLVLLSAFRRLQMTDPDTVLLIVGEGTLSDAARTAARSGRRVVYAGRLDGEALWQAYCAADVLVLPAEAEPWGLVVNEAMAFGLPVVVTREVGCVDDLVEGGETGLLVDLGSADSLLAAMTSLASQPGMRRRMAHAATQRIAGWTLQAEARIICDAWAQVLGT